MIKLTRIVCPTDFSPTASRAVDYAAALADSFGAKLVLLHVIPEMSYPLRSFGMASSFPHLKEELHERAREELDKRAAAIKSQLPKVEVSIDLRDGEAHEAALECAKAHGADMIVIGTHGHTGLKHALLGSTAERVVRMSDCPVLTVRTHD
jgi:nucleotide-binding universal stress UspA family protein